MSPTSTPSSKEAPSQPVQATTEDVEALIDLAEIGHQDPDYMTTRGVTLQFLVALRDKLRVEGILYAGSWTSTVASVFLRDFSGASVIDALSAAGAGGVAGEAGWYIIHSRQASFDDLVQAVEAFFADKGDDPARTVVWLDALSLPQMNPVRTTAFVQETLSRAIRRIGRSLLVFDNVVQAKAANDLLCFWEVYHSTQVDVVFPPSQVMAFEQRLLKLQARVLDSWVMVPKKSADKNMAAFNDFTSEQIKDSAEKLWKSMWIQIQRIVEDTNKDDLESACWSMVHAAMAREALDMLTSDMDWTNIDQRERKAKLIAMPI
ncbi:hypothetical protein HK101_009388 [Irineochytrium annulatum]|nr:hypothetical protein HK101_009388 [Irineochytrium annulatum]